MWLIEYRNEINWYNHCYLDELVEGKCIFHEFGVKVNGPIVAELGKSFISTLEIAKVPIRRDPFEATESFDDGSLIQILESNPWTRNKSIQEVFKYMLKNAEKGIFIATSYFHPEGAIRRRILEAKKRKVPIHLLLSGKSDIHCDVDSTIHLANKLMSHPPSNSDKLKIYLTNKWHFHGKAMMVDDLWTSIGTYNMDRLSSRRNMEISLGILDYRIAKKVKEIQLSYSSQYYADQLTLDTMLQVPMHKRIYGKFCHCCYKFLSSSRWLDWFTDEGFKNRFRHTFIRTFIEDNVGTLLASASSILGM